LHIKTREADKKTNDKTGRKIEENITSIHKEENKASIYQSGINLGSGLIPLNILVIALVLAITFLPSNLPSNIIRIILGIPFLIFFPGYTLMAALFPQKEGIDTIQRVTLSLILSIAVVSLIGLVLNYTHWGIILESVLYSSTAFIFITSLVALLRRIKLTGYERFGIQLRGAMPGWGTGWHRALTITMLIAILGALGALGYFIATPEVGETFTDFYILNLEGVSANYTSNMTAGEEGKVIVGILNHEGEEVNYRVEVVIGSSIIEVGPVTLANEQKWEEEVGFVPEDPVEDQKVEFLLYKNDESEPYLEPLYIWIDFGERFTDFYILGQEGISANYTSELKVGEEGKVIVGILNNEGEEVNYRVEVVIDSSIIEVGPVTLSNKQKWEEEVSFVPDAPVEDQKVEFLLYKYDEPEPYLEPLYIWINVTE
jgi:uncharacterized membrane protein